MAYEDITLAIEGGLATVTLNRPDALNAISLQMLADLDAALDEIKIGRASCRERV